jgi:hypothetical protein
MKYLFLIVLGSAMFTTIMAAMLASVMMSEMRIFLDEQKRVNRISLD